MKGSRSSWSCVVFVFCLLALLVTTGASTALASPTRAGKVVLLRQVVPSAHSVTPATSGQITEYSIPTANSQPYGITQGPDGTLWFTESTANKIGNMTTVGTFSEFPIPTSGSFPNSITTGSDGNLWFTETHGNQIGRITPGGTITEFPIPTAASAPYGITTGHDGNVWFTESSGNKIASITPSGGIAEFPVPTPNSSPAGITANSSPIEIPASQTTILWFVEQAANNLGVFDATLHQFKEYPLIKSPCKTQSPVNVTFGGVINGNQIQTWYTMQKGNCTLHGSSLGPGIPQKVSFAQNKVPSGSNTYGIATAEDRSSIIAEPEGNNLERITLKNQVTEYPVPTAKSMPWAVTAGPQNAMWFTELMGNKIGVLSFGLPNSNIVLNNGLAVYQPNMLTCNHLNNPALSITNKTNVPQTVTQNGYHVITIQPGQRDYFNVSGPGTIIVGLVSNPKAKLTLICT